MRIVFVAVEGESDQNSGALRIPQIGEEPLPHGALQGQSPAQISMANPNPSPLDVHVPQQCNVLLHFRLIHPADVCSPSSVPTMTFLRQDLSQLVSTKPHAQHARRITHFIS